MTMEAKKCTPKCEFFRCGQKSLQFRSGKPYCRLAEDVCEGYKCRYAICIRNRLLPDGTCSLTIKRSQRQAEIPLEDEDILKKIKVKGKLQKRLGKEIF